MWETRRRMAMPAGPIFALHIPRSAPRGRKTIREAGHGYRLFLEAHDGERRVGHVPDDGRSGEHQGRRQALSAGQHGPAGRHGQEDRLFADGRGPGAAVRAQSGTEPRHRGEGCRPLPHQRVQAARRSGHGDPRHQERDPDGRAAAAARPVQGNHHGAARAGAGGRRDRLGQVDDAGGDDRSSQLEYVGPHPHRSRTRSNTCTATRSRW